MTVILWQVKNINVRKLKLKRKKKPTKKDTTVLNKLTTQLESLENREQSIKDIRTSPNILGSFATSYAAQQGIDSIITEKVDENAVGFKVSEAVRTLYDYFGVEMAEKGLPSRLLGYFDGDQRKCEYSHLSRL